eukprot:401041_1
MANKYQHLPLKPDEPVQYNRIEETILKRDKQDNDNAEDRSFTWDAISNWLLGIIKLILLVYCSYASCSLILGYFTHSNANFLQIYNILFELVICIFVMHDALSSGGWKRGVSNSLWLFKFAKLIPYYAYNQQYNCIPKNYLRAILILFVASISSINCDNNDIFNSKNVENCIRYLNIPMIIFGIMFVFIARWNIKYKIIRCFVDWIAENNLDYDSKQAVIDNTISTNVEYQGARHNIHCDCDVSIVCVLGWISIMYNVCFFWLSIGIYIYIIYHILSVSSNELDAHIVIACIAKCFVSLLISIYLLFNRQVMIQMNWAHFIILLYTLNVSISLFYFHEYCNDYEE